MFEQTNGLAHRLDVGGLRDLVKAGGTSLRLVFVAACHSEAAARCFRDAGVPCVVAVRLKEQGQQATCSPPQRSGRRGSIRSLLEGRRFSRTQGDAK